MSALTHTLPLKLGLMRASYPDVFPMSLSRKSEGDSCGPALLGGFISSLQELSLILPRERGERGETEREREGTNTKGERKKDKVWENSRGGVCLYMRCSSGGGARKIMRSQQNEKPTAITESVISKKSPAVDGEMRVKNDATACLSWQLKAYPFPIMSETYCAC